MAALYGGRKYVAPSATNQEQRQLRILEPLRYRKYRNHYFIFLLCVLGNKGYVSESRVCAETEPRAVCILSKHCTG